MGNLRKSASDRGLMSEGVWRTFDDDIQVRIRSSRSTAVRDVLNQLSIEQKASRSRTKGVVESDSETRKRLFPVIVAAWENLQLEEGGEAIPCNEASILRICMDPEYHEFADWILEQSGLDANYAQAAIEDAAGN